MTWIKFALCLFSIYTLYYTLLLGWDFSRKSTLTNDDHPTELTFLENLETVKQISGETEITEVASPVVSSGGVSLKQFFNLAREESVTYIKAVSF